jgi:hypothetical protein
LRMLQAPCLWANRRASSVVARGTSSWHCGIILYYCMRLYESVQRVRMGCVQCMHACTSTAVGRSNECLRL